MNFASNANDGVDAYEALDKFRVLKIEVKLQLGTKVQILKMDKGGKYFHPSYFKSYHIIHVTIVGCAPQSNGVLKNTKCTLQEMVNSMLSYLGLRYGFGVRLC